MSKPTDQPTVRSTIEVNEIIEQLNAYILSLARRNIPRHLSHPETLDLEIDELAQNIRIKLWKAFQRETIANPKAYIRCIANTGSIDMMRSHKGKLPLPIDEDGELYQGKIMVAFSEEMQDPLYRIEQEEVLGDYMVSIAKAVQTLPPRQQHAMICSLKDQLDDVFQLVNAFRKQKVNIEDTTWPEEKSEMYRLKASLSAARKKLQPLLECVGLPS